MEAVKSGNITKVRKFISENVNQMNAGNPLLHIAYQNKQMDIFDALLEAGANPNLLNEYNETLLLVALMDNNPDVVGKLLAAGVDPNVSVGKIPPLYIASENGYLEIVEKLLAYGANVNKDSDSVTPLHNAIYSESTNLVKTLLNAGADVNKQTNTGFAPLHIACERGLIDIVGILVDAGANINAITAKGFTPIYIAASFGYDDIVEFLLEAGVNVTQDVIKIASYKSRKNVLKLLKSESANMPILFTDIESRILDMMRQKREFKLKFTFKSQPYSIVFKAHNIFTLANPCVYVSFADSFNEYKSMSSLHANRGDIPCFEPRLTTIENPRITSADVLQVLSTKLKILIRKNIMGFHAIPMTISDVAVINKIQISPYRILRGQTALYEKYGYVNESLNLFRKKLPTLTWGDVKHLLPHDIVEKYNPELRDADLVFTLIKNIPDHEEAEHEISSKIVDAFVENFYFTLDETSDAWKEWDAALQFTDVAVAGGARGRRTRKRKCARI